MPKLLKASFLASFKKKPPAQQALHALLGTYLLFLLGSIEQQDVGCDICTDLYKDVRAKHLESESRNVQNLLADWCDADERSSAQSTACHTFFQKVHIRKQLVESISDGVPASE